MLHDAWRVCLAWFAGVVSAANCTSGAVSPSSVAAGLGSAALLVVRLADAWGNAVNCTAAEAALFGLTISPGTAVNVTTWCENESGNASRLVVALSFGATGAAGVQTVSVRRGGVEVALPRPTFVLTSGALVLAPDVC